MPFTQVKLILIAIAFVATLSGIWGGYSYIKNIGYNEAQAECIKKFEDYQKQVDDRMVKLQTSISTVSELLVTTNDNLSQDISIILSRTKNKPSVVNKDGKCQNNVEFIKDINDAINRVNAEGAKK